MGEQDPEGQCMIQNNKCVAPDRRIHMPHQQPTQWGGRYKT
eukprot:gene15800-25313_t